MTPPRSATAATSSSGLFRGESQNEDGLPWVMAMGWAEASTASRPVTLPTCEMSTRTPASFRAATIRCPARVRPPSCGSQQLEPRWLAML